MINYIVSHPIVTMFMVTGLMMIYNLYKHVKKNERDAEIEVKCKAREEAELLKQKELERKAKKNAEIREKEEFERKINAEAEWKAKEEAERWVKEIERQGQLGIWEKEIAIKQAEFNRLEQSLVVAEKKYKKSCENMYVGDDWAAKSLRKKHYNEIQNLKQQIDLLREKLYC